jgi:tripartite-type tricarboxylate transporter receptor subunit TctC
MRKTIRLILRAACLLSAFFLSISHAGAAFPERGITMLVGFAPGGSVDLSARALAVAAEKILKQPVVIENKTGGTGTVALMAMLSQNPDGYTLCMTPSSVLIRVPQTQQVPYKPFRSFRPIVGFAAPPLGIVVKADSPWRSLKDLVNEARRQPGKLKFATTGVGSTTQAAVDEIVFKERLQLIHIPYKGGSEALASLMGGHVEFASLTSEFIPAVKSGQIRLLATMNEKRSPKFPGVPTLREAGYDFTNDAVFAVVGPAGLPPAVAAGLEAAFTEAAQSRELLETLDRIDMVPAHYRGREFDDFLRTTWKRINQHLRATGLIKEAATSPE